MFAGHIGVALAIGRVERRVNVGVFAAAALLLDLLLWLFILLGWESVKIPADFAATHQPEFVFPWSHGLAAAAAWSVLAAALSYQLYRPAMPRAAGLVAAAVFSHWLLDALVHRPELPLAGGSSAVVGLGLWNHLGVALGVEAALMLCGLALFLPGCGMPRRRSIALAASCLLILLFTMAGMTFAPPPPSAFAMAASSWATLVLVCALIGWLGRRPTSLAAAG